MNLKRYYWLYLLVLIIFSGLFIYLILNNVSAEKSLSNSINSSSFLIKIKKIFPSPTPKPKKDLTRILFAGDVSFDRYIRQVSEKKSYDFVLSDLTNFLNEYDVVVVNFESPITNNQSVSVESEIGSRENYIFTSDPITIQTLKKNNISIINIGNNHIGNFGENGYKDTINYLTKSNLDFFGNTIFSNEKTFLIKEIRGIKIGFVNFNQFISDGYSRAMKDIESVRSGVDVLVLMAHWDNEYQKVAATITKNRAHSFIDVGVDLIIGSHPHVVQNHEIYNGKHIYYSLGNFVFDQYFLPQTQRGLLVEVIIDAESKKIITKEYFIRLKTNGQTTLEE